MASKKHRFPSNEDGIIELATYIIQSFDNIEKYKIADEANISSIFLAWAPGAGKSEFLETIFSELKENFIVIDIDSYRCMFEGYTGENASDFQQASVKIADKILKFCFQNNLNFIFDGTFRNYEKVKQNLNQCEKYNRKSILTLIFQEPRISFYYTFLRKLEKKRNVPVDIFIDGFYSSIFNVFRASREFENIKIFIASKEYSNIEKREFTYKILESINDIESFCKKFKIWYSKWVFTNRDKLTIDIKGFQDTLIANYCGKRTFLSRLKLWFFKNFFNR